MWQGRRIPNVIQHGCAHACPWPEHKAIVSACCHMTTHLGVEGRSYGDVSVMSGQLGTLCAGARVQAIDSLGGSALVRLQLVCRLVAACSTHL